MKERFKSNKYYMIGFTAFSVIAASIAFYFLLLRLDEIGVLIGKIISLFSPFIIGFIFAYLLNPIVVIFNKNIFSKLVKDNNKLSMKLSILLTCIVFIGIIVLLFSFIIPELLKSIETIAVNFPAYVEEVKNYLLNKAGATTEFKTMILENYDKINAYITNFLNTNLLPKVEDLIVAFSDGVFGAVKIIFNIFMGFVISIYYLGDKDNFVSGIKKLTFSIFPLKIANNIIENARHTDHIFGNFIIGKLLDGASVGFITFLFLSIFGYPYALLIGVIIGLTNMIPYFGPYIGTVPSALLILMDNPTKCFIFILFIIALQQVDSYVIEPRLCGARTGLKSFWVLASILLFGNMFGIVGMLVAVPIFALIYGFLNNLFTSRLKSKGLPTANKDYLKVDRINSETGKIVKFK